MIQTIIGLCGLHGCGKSHIAKRISELLGYEILNKRAYLQFLYKRYEPDSLDEDWEAWYRSLYQERGAKDIMGMILDEYCLINPVPHLTVVDAIHNIEEWKLIKDAYRSILILVSSPQQIRYERHPKPPCDTVKLDQRRVRYGHANTDIDDLCLFAQAEWAFSGIMPHELLDLSINALGQWLK